LTVAFVAAGCGGGSDASSTQGSTSTEGSSSAEDWANSLCGAVASWNDAITSAGTTLKDDPTEDGLKSAADKVQSATQTLSDDLESLGAPDTENGQGAKESVDELAAGLAGGLDEIQTAVEDASGLSGALAAISAVSTRLMAMGDQVSSTVRSLEDTRGELTDAFAQAESCNELSGTATG
jgi:phage-related protein